MQGTHIKQKIDLGIPGRESASKCYKMLEKSYDNELGGFGEAPKFPQPGNFKYY